MGALEAKYPAREESMSFKILAIGAHPDDLEFGCGAILIKEARRGSEVHCLVGSRGEAGSHGNAELRSEEAARAAASIPAQLHWLDLGGDAHMEADLTNALKLAERIRTLKPQLILAPTGELDQHPDHVVVHQLALRASRLARYGKVRELQELAPHRIESLFFYRIGSFQEGRELQKFRVDITAVVEEWQALMACHASQVKAQGYIPYQLSRARTEGMEAGVEYALPLYSYRPVLVDSLGSLS